MTEPCCLCHCALDYSDLQACQFVGGDTNNDNFRSHVESNHGANSQQLAIILYNPHNGLLQCDSCSRRYHYQCHFVPIFSPPRQGSWQCLVCTSHHEMETAASQSRETKNRGRHNSIGSSNPNDDNAVQFHWNDLFCSPPIASVTEQEVAWESHPVVIDCKARSLSLSLQTLTKTITAAVGRYSRSTATLETLTANARNRQHFLQRGQRSRGAHRSLEQAASAAPGDDTGTATGPNGDNAVVSESLSQELMQCLVARVTAQRTLRHLVLFALQHVQRNAVARTAWDALMRHCQQTNKTQHTLATNNAIFPLGVNAFVRRWTPVTPEYAIQTQTEATASASIPFEIDVTMSNASNGKMPPKTAKTSAQDQNDDEDDGISLDELQCCVCLKGECSDENDLLMCDGNGCFRAYHMECVHPHVSPDTAAEEHADDDWFCPLCETLADVLYQIQAGTVGGEEWEERRLARPSHTTEETDVVDSLASWTDADQVFPDAEWAFQTAQQLRRGVHSADTQRLLSQVLGMETSTPEHKRLPENTVNGLHQTVNAAGNEPEDDDNVDEDGHFDMYSYQEERRIEREERRKETGEDDDSVSTHSSQVTLVELSSVELNVGKDELAALTDVEEDDESDDEKPPVRSSRRLRSRHPRDAGRRPLLDNGTNNENADLGRMDVTNIVAGKRKRKTVDYQLLNQAMFGEVGAAALETLDDGDDFVFDGNNKAAFHSDDDDDNHDEASDEDIEENDSNEDGSDEVHAKKDGESSKEDDDSDGDDCIVEIVRKRAERLANKGAENGMKNGRRGKIVSGSKRN
jgi:PHD-finger